MWCRDQKVDDLAQHVVLKGVPVQLGSIGLCGSEDGALFVVPAVRPNRLALPTRNPFLLPFWAEEGEDVLHSGQDVNIAFSSEL